MSHTPEFFRAKILAQKSALETERENLSSGYVEGDGQMSDAGADLAEIETQSAIYANLDASLAQIDAALAKLDAGTYGVCDRCGKAIAELRLVALPVATMCIECQSVVEGQI